MEPTIPPSSVEQGLQQLRELNALRERVVPAITREILNQLPVAVILVDMDGRIVLFSKQAEIIFGYKEDVVLGKEIEMLLPERIRDRHREHRTRYSVQPQTRSMGGSGGNRMKLIGLTKRGVEVSLDISLSPVVTEEETLIVTTIQAA